MKYVFDNNTLRSIFDHYFYGRFPSFWKKFNPMIKRQDIVSVREVRRELEAIERGDTLDVWAKNNPGFFVDPTDAEMQFIRKIYRVKHFRQNLTSKKIILGGAFADPFLIAKAYVNEAIVVTQEKLKEHAAKIPNICDHFGVECTNLEGFLIKENWKF